MIMMDINDDKLLYYPTMSIIYLTMSIIYPIIKDGATRSLNRWQTSILIVPHYQVTHQVVAAAACPQWRRRLACDTGLPRVTNVRSNTPTTYEPGRVMMIYYDDDILWWYSMMMIYYDDDILWWWYTILWWYTLMMIYYDDILWCYSLMIYYDNDILWWWFTMMIYY